MSFAGMLAKFFRFCHLSVSHISSARLLSSSSPSLSLSLAFHYLIFLLFFPPRSLPLCQMNSSGREEGEGGRGGGKHCRKFSLNKTRIEQWRDQRERERAEGLLKRGTVWLFAGGCCYSSIKTLSALFINCSVSHTVIAFGREMVSTVRNKIFYLCNYVVSSSLFKDS